MSTEAEIKESQDNGLVEHWQKKIKEAKEHHSKAFKRMAEDMKFCKGAQSNSDDHYVANFTLRHVQNKVAALYAKDPKIVATRRQKMLFKVWDGDIQAVSEAKQAIAQIKGDALLAADPSAQAAAMKAEELLTDYEQGVQNAKMIERVGETLESLLSYFLIECEPRFKPAAKQAVRRAVTTSVAYCKLGYQRTMGKSPDDESAISDYNRQLEHLNQLAKENKEEPFEEGSAKAEELRAMISEIERKPEIVLREGLVFNWPRSNRVIWDKSTTDLMTFTGTTWGAEEYLFKVSKIESIFGVSLERGEYNVYGRNAEGGAEPKDADEGDSKDDYVLVWEVYDKTTGLCFTLCDGGKTWLKAPALPEVEIEQFFPWFPLIFNSTEDEKDIFPPSDVRLLRPIQQEYNRARHNLREHRIASRPGTCGPPSLTEQDKENLRTRPNMAHIELQGLQPGQSASEVIAPLPVSNIDQNLYETSSLFDDTQRVVGVAEANIGGVSKATATESSIAESTRQSGVTSNVDDMDEWLSNIARAAGQILLKEMSEEQVIDICGPGAVWPELSKEDIQKDVWLTVEAGSSGKPNKALEISNWERLMPYMLQIPGVSPKWLFKESIRRYDDSLSIEDAFMEGMSSITAMNNMNPQGAQGQAQGAQGSMNDSVGAGQQESPNLGNPTAHQQQ